MRAITSHHIFIYNLTKRTLLIGWLWELEGRESICDRDKEQSGPCKADTMSW